MATVYPEQNLVCANSAQNNPTCTRVGKLACKECRLVLYCNANCQKAHWTTHKPDCRNNPLLKSNWRPSWELENRQPSFIGGPKFQSFNYRKKFPWGNMPAFDLLNLASNEGVNYDGDLNLLFAASGDMRNLLVTLASMGDGCRSPMRIYMNDRDGDIVGRNATMLLLALTEDDSTVVADNIIHTFYSAFIPQSLYETLQGKIRDMVQDVCKKIEAKAPDTVLAKTWTFGSRSLRLVLAKKQWFELLASLELPPGLTIEKAHQIRQSVTLAAERVDFRERSYFSQTPGERTSGQRFRESGVLLPFGAPRDSFTIPNPTLFRDTDTWPLKDDADPINGWQKQEILKFPSGAAINDIYGKLNFFLGDIITRFHRRLMSSDIMFQLLNVNAEDLQKHVGQVLFDRIETANISDGGYLGMERTIFHIGPLLKHPCENPHAALVVLFLNAVHEMFHDEDRQKMAAHEIKEVWKYRSPQPPSGPYDADWIINNMATEQVRDVDKYFDRYMRVVKFTEIAEFSGMEFKKQSTIIEPWPLKVKKKPHQRGAKEEFNTLLSSSHSGCERYMEWRFKM
ncbi:hypothetical protein F4804DRAFT_317033 [Jackrogersella minutella]|nr:hypothetical protein F4804DRAFT_317033 [Jackrogersella minutella]